VNALTNSICNYLPVLELLLIGTELFSHTAYSLRRTHETSPLDDPSLDPPNSAQLALSEERVQYLTPDHIDPRSRTAARSQKYS
jgi:hypothetical protein